MKIPRSTQPPYRHADRESLTSEFWNEIRDSAFSLAGVVHLIGAKAGVTVESENQKMRQQALADGADQEFCDVVERLYTGFYYEGMASVKTAKLSPPGFFGTADGKKI